MTNGTNTNSKGTAVGVGAVGHPVHPVHPVRTKRTSILSLLFALVILSSSAAGAQNAPPSVVAGIPVNYDEAKVGTYTLPDPLVLNDGTRVRDAMTWWVRRRDEVLRLFETNQFGRAPGRPPGMRFELLDSATTTFDGYATRRQVRIHLAPGNERPFVDVLLYVPRGLRARVPVLLNVSFSPNRSTVVDSGIVGGDSSWARDGKRVAAPPAGRGALNPRPFLAQGIGVATVYYGDIDPDFAGGLPYGVRAAYLKPGQTTVAPDAWGAIAAWAWGLSRVMDYLETDPDVDARKVALVGVSRLGKTVLWAAARDERFALVIASCSGEGGAALSRRDYGETVAHITHPTRYGYQFAGNYATYASRVDSLPMDAHMLLALVAPRPVLLQTGDTDFWSDPRGEFLAAVAAEPVFNLLGARGLDTKEMPPVGTAILHTLGWYEHAGGHGTIPSDWDVFLRFLRLHFQGVAP
ncbi:hypothetical protein [Gemmatirosa kalamazoonensis]|nr:hypothetical protein [Gemmatirosa kalamazoonensis]